KHSNVFSGPVLIARGLDLELASSLWSFEGVRACAKRLDNFGGHSGGGTPPPIPNRDVKPASADGTRRATSRESRSPPKYLEKRAARAVRFRSGKLPAAEVCPACDLVTGRVELP